MRREQAALGFACALAFAWTTAQAAPADGRQRAVRALGARGPLGDERLSDERTLSRYGAAVARAAVRAAPDTGAAHVARLHYLTEDGPFEVYPVLESRLDSGARVWLRIRLPMRPNGSSGWVPRDDLGPLHAVTTRLNVDRAKRRATLYRDGRSIWTSLVGIGKPSTPTPAGRFWIRTRLRGLRASPIYGPYAFGTGAYSALSDWPGGGVVGIHGTDEPRLIPGRPSHGCIRVPNAAITRLWKLMPIGTPVRIV
jgi:hypothetical protein